MDTNITTELDERLWADIQNTHSQLLDSPMLSHYTSLCTLEKIIQHDEIWLSNPLFMNDYEEIRFGMIEGARLFRESETLRKACGTSENHQKLIESFDELFNEFDKKYLIDTYVLCLSKHNEHDNDGSLSMWRGYGDSGGGAAIVFDARKVVVPGATVLMLDKVHYGSSETRISWINEKIGQLATIIESNHPTGEILRECSRRWIERLKIFSLFTKHQGFHEENEWRLVYLAERDQGKLFSSMISYHVTSKGVEPKLKLKIKPLPGVFRDGLSLEEIVDRIILGPTISSAMSRAATCRMLNILGKNELASKIRSSSIPYRTKF